MNRLNYFSLKNHINYNLVIVVIVYISMPFSVCSQNYVAANSEMNILSGIDFSISSSWETNKSSTPGYFTWLAGAENFDGATDLHHIDGYVKKIGSDAFTFPVGSGTDLRTLSISAPTTLTSEYAVSWISGNPNTTQDPTNSNAIHSTTAISGVITAVNDSGQWDWVPINGTGAGLTITVSIPAMTGTNFTNAADLRLVGWNGVTWISLGTTGASGITEDSTLTGVMIAGIQAIGIGSIKTLNLTVTPPTLIVEQNSDGFLVVNGIAEKGNSVFITFPDGTNTTVLVDNQGKYGPVTSSFPQANVGVVTARAINSVGVSSSLVSVSYNYPIEVYVSEAFTPNGDGINDTWNIYQLEQYPNSTVRVFNKLGNEIFQSINYKNDWDGHYKYSSVTSESGSYFYQIDYGSNGSIDKQGWLYIRK